MTIPLILTATLALLVLFAVFLLGRCWQRWRSQQDMLSPVSRQHFEIFQSGEFNEETIQRVKRRLHLLFERGGESAVEQSLRPGTQFIYQVRALAEIGTDAAGRILERQLHRRLSDNHLDQAWYWIDLAACLRVLNRQESLPHLLRCSENARESPLGHYFAAETISFLGFAGYLRHPHTPSGQAALRLLHRALEGMRYGVAPALILDARVGEIVETMWDHRPDRASALHVRIAQETLRLVRRGGHLKTMLGEEIGDTESFDWQLSRIASLDSAIRDYLKEAPAPLLLRVRTTRGPELVDLLQALNDLRVDAADALLPLIERDECEQRDRMIEVLRWSRDPRVAGRLRDLAREQVPMEKRARARRQIVIPRRSSIAPTIPYRSILFSLRGHPSASTELFLMLACRDWDPTIRMAALGSLGWWEPILKAQVHDCLAACRRDASPEVRQSARAALARLGERASLHWFRQALLAEDSHQTAEAAHLVASEGLTLLWPELDRLLDVDDPEIALHAHEAVEQLAEEMEHSRTGSL